MNCPFGGHLWDRDRKCSICGMPHWVWTLTRKGTEPWRYRDLIESRPDEYPEVPMQYDTIHGWRVRL